MNYKQLYTVNENYEQITNYMNKQLVMKH